MHMKNHVMYRSSILHHNYTLYNYIYYISSTRSSSVELLYNCCYYGLTNLEKEEKNDERMLKVGASRGEYAIVFLGNTELYILHCVTYCTIHIYSWLLYTYVHVLMRDERKEASKVKQTTRQSNTAHPR